MTTNPNLFDQGVALLQGGKPVTLDRPQDSDLTFWRDLLLV